MSKKSPKSTDESFDEAILAAAESAMAPKPAPSQPAAASPVDAFFAAIRAREPNQSSLAKTAKAHPEYAAHIDSAGFNALTMALVSDKFELAKALAEQGSDVNLASTAMGWNPLVIACGRSAGDDSLASLLLAKGAHPSSKTHDGLYALTSACSYGNVALARRLLDAGAHPSPEDAGWLPVIAAAGSGSVELVDLLAERGAKTDQPLGPTHGFCAIHQAAKAGHAPVVERLIALGSNVNALDNEGRSPLHYAAQRGDAATAAVLLKAGAKKALENVAGKTPADLCRDPALAKTLQHRDDQRVKHPMSGEAKKAAKAEAKAKAPAKTAAKAAPKKEAAKKDPSPADGKAMQALAKTAAGKLSSASKPAAPAKAPAKAKAKAKKSANPLIQKTPAPKKPRA